MKRNTRVTATTWLAGLALLLVGMCIGRVGEPVSPAEAQQKPRFGNTGGQIEKLVGLQEKTNAKLDGLMSLLASGKVKVQIVAADTTKPEGKDHGDDKPPKK